MIGAGAGLHQRSPSWAWWAGVHSVVCQGYTRGLRGIAELIVIVNPVLGEAKLAVGEQRTVEGVEDVGNQRIVPPRPRSTLPPAEALSVSAIHAVEWEITLTPRARLLLPGNQQFKFTAALARHEVTVWASDRSIHIILDGAVIRTRPSRLSEHDLRDLLARGARIAGPEPARGRGHG